MNPLLLSKVLSDNGFSSIICYWYHNHKVIACFLSYRLFANLVSLSLITTLVVIQVHTPTHTHISSSFDIKIHDSMYFSCLQSLLNHNRALIPTITARPNMLNIVSFGPYRPHGFVPGDASPLLSLTPQNAFNMLAPALLIRPATHPSPADVGSYK